ncbi:MAG TPA: dihydroorotate dehydrogenase electron transfer subunit [bacterium]|nr:dihydroorotate dehydrogenase electron transfer subunit [bacterium]
MKYSLKSEVKEVRAFGEDCYELRLNCPEIAACARPGQFVQLKAWEGPEPLLRRPISIAGVPDPDSILLWVRRVGRGTGLITGVLPGDTMEVVGPLGNGFSPVSEGEVVYMVGGKLGAAPMRFFSTGKGLGAGSRFFYGAACECDLDLLGDPVIECLDVCVATEDGCAGTKGFVTEALVPAMEEKKPDRIVACGPHGMLRAVADIAEAAGVVCEVSMETYMSCGIGACMGCAVPVKEGGPYMHACTDGPVFDSRIIDWEAF